MNVSGGLTIPVAVSYAIESELVATPNPISLSSSNSSVQLTVSAASGTVPFAAAASSGYNSGWLTVNPTSGIASSANPATLTVSVQPSALPTGPATGFITLKPEDGSSTLTVQVFVNAGTDTTINVAPAQLTFAYQENGPAPVSQSVTLTSSAAASYNVQFVPASGGNWLNVAPASLTTQAGGTTTLTATVSASGLAANPYNGQIVLTNSSSGAQQIVPVTLTVGPQIVVVSAVPQALTFNAVVGGGTAIPTQTVQLTASGGAAIFTASATGLNGAPNFLTVSASGSSTPSTLVVGLNTAVVSGLGAGTYNGGGYDFVAEYRGRHAKPSRLLWWCRP